MWNPLSFLRASAVRPHPETRGPCPPTIVQFGKQRFSDNAPVGHQNSVCTLWCLCHPFCREGVCGGFDGLKIGGRIWVIGVSAPAVVTGFTYEMALRKISVTPQARSATKSRAGVSHQAPTSVTSRSGYFSRVFFPWYPTPFVRVEHSPALRTHLFMPWRRA